MAIQTKDPSAAVITSVGAAIDGGTANSTTPVIKGTADAGDIVNIYDGVRVIGSALVAADGTWSFTPSAALKGGTHTFAAIAHDSEGNYGASSVPLSVQIGSTVVTPAAPGITALTDNVGPITGSITNGMTTDDSRPVLTGTGTAGNTITVYDGATAIGTATVAANGTWSVQPATALANGTHDLYATQTNSAGTSGHSSDISFTVNTSTPAKPVINGMSDDNGAAIPAGSTTSDAHPHISGTGTAGDIIKVYDGATLIGSTTVDANGKWDFKPATDLSNGAHSISATDTNPAGTTSAKSDAVALTVDSTTPAKPVINGMSDDNGAAIPAGSTTSDAHPHISGTGTAGDIIKVYDGATLLGSTTVDANGKWDFKPTTDLSNGAHSISATDTNPAGTTSASSTPIAVTVDTTVPAAPVITSATDAVGPVQGAIPANGYTDDSHPTIAGTAKAGDIIKILNNGTVIGSTTADASGKWSFKPTAALPEGATVLTATDTNAAGTTSAKSASLSFTVDTLSGALPVITSATGTVGGVANTVLSGGITADTKPAINGTGHPGDIIKVYDGSTTYLWGSTTVGADGKWTMTPASVLNNATHNLFATAASGNATGAVSAHTAFFPIQIDTSIPATPAAPTFTDDSGHAIPAGSTTADAHPHINGTGTAGDIIKVYDNGAVIGSTTIGTDGKWSFTPATDMANGNNSITVIETNPAGTSSAASTPVVITVDTTTPAKPATPVLSDDSGVSIPAGSTTADGHPHISGTGTKGDIIKVYDGATLLGSTTVDANGKWDFKPSTDLSNGTRSISVTDTNLAGTTSASSTPIAVTVDTSVPAAPVITSATDAVGPVQGAIPANGYTDDSHPTIAGTAKAGDIVKILNNGTVIGSTTADASGKWSFKPTAALPEGATVLTATDTNAAGTTSAKSASLSFTVDTLSGALPVITSATGKVGGVTNTVLSGGITADTEPAINGTGHPGDIIKVYDGSTAYFWGSATVGADGKWTMTPASALNNATHNLFATATSGNASGAVSAHTAFFPIQVDTSTPAKPSVPVLTDDAGASIPAGSTSSDGHPHISGTGTTGDIVKVYDGATLIGSTTVGTDGKWTVTPTTDLSTGAHSISATETNAAGTTSPQSDAISYTYGIIPTETVTISGLLEHTYAGGPQIAVTGNGTADRSPMVQGSVSIALQPGESLVVYRDGTKLGNATMVGTAWSYQDANVAVGSHTYTARVESVGGKGAVSNSLNFSEWTNPGNMGSLSGTAYLDQDHSINDYIDFNMPGAPLGLTTATYSLADGTNISSTIHLGGVAYNTVNGYCPQINYRQIVVFSYLGHPVGWVGAGDVSGFLPYRPGVQQTFTLNDISSVPPTVGKTLFGTTATVSAVHDVDTEHASLADAAANAAQHSDADAAATTTEAPSATHQVVNDSEVFIGKTGHDTVDLNVDPTSYFKESTAHIQGSTAHPVEAVGAAPAANTLHLTGDHQILDLTSLSGKTAAAKISGIEVIDLGGHSNNLKLSLTDVLNLGEQDLFQKDGKQQMMVNGSDGDKVDLSNAHIAGVADGQWQAEGTAVVSGVTYNVYEHSGAHTELLVQQGVQIALHN